MTVWDRILQNVKRLLRWDSKIMKSGKQKNAKKAGSDFKSM